MVHRNPSAAAGRPFIVGLTGGIGSGKSTVERRFAALGVDIVDTDRIAHELTAPGGAAIEPIRAEFGDEVIAPDGRVGFMMAWGLDPQPVAASPLPPALLPGETPGPTVTPAPGRWCSSWTAHSTSSAPSFASAARSISPARGPVSSARAARSCAATDSGAPPLTRAAAGSAAAGTGSTAW